MELTSKLQSGDFSSALADMKERVDIVCRGVFASQKPGLLPLTKRLSVLLSVLHKHIQSKSKILIFADVDMDGIGSVYIMYDFLKHLGLGSNVVLAINSNKEHGLTTERVEKLNSLDVDLYILLDSSSNDWDILKHLKSDVLVIDHHGLHENAVLHATKDDGGVFCVVNQASGEFGDLSCSAGLLVYEVLRCLESEFGYSVTEIRKHSHVAAITLISDVITTWTPRNLYYLHSAMKEKPSQSMQTAIRILGFGRKTKISKSFINFDLAPLFNAAIRAGAGREALEIFVNHIHLIDSLKDYKKQQSSVVGLYKCTDVVGTGSVGVLSLKESSHVPYAGLIAARMAGDRMQSCFVFYPREDGTLKGSFRGFGEINHRKVLQELADSLRLSTIESEGHESAFGIWGNPDELNILFSEAVFPKKVVVSDTIVFPNDNALPIEGNIEAILKELGGFSGVGEYNSLVSGKEVCYFILDRCYLTFDYANNARTMFSYLFTDGTKVTSFSELKTPFVKIVPEWTESTLNVYAYDFLG